MLEILPGIKVFSLNFDMGIANPLLFLGNVQWNLVKEYQNIYFPHCNCIYQL